MRCQTTIDQIPEQEFSLEEIPPASRITKPVAIVLLDTESEPTHISPTSAMLPVTKLKKSGSSKPKVPSLRRGI